MRPVLACIFVALLFVFGALSQTPAPPQVTLTGNIADTFGASIPGATVTFTATGFTRTVSTGSDGTYSTPVPVGTYTIRVEASGFLPVELTVDASRSRHFDVTLSPASFTGDIPVITSIGDAAAGRAQYLPESELAQGTLFTAYGNFAQAQVALAGSTPWPTLLGGVQAQVRGASGVKQVQLFVTTPTQISGVIPSSTPLGLNNLVVIQGTKESKPAPFIVVDSRPTFFTIRQTGSGPVVATHLDYSVITPDNPAAPNENIVLWGNNWGASPKDGEFAVKDFRFIWDQYHLYLGGKELAPSQIQFAGVAGTNYGQMNINLGPNPPTGCKVPIHFGWGDRLGARTRWSNPVTIPIRAAGPPAPCSDENGFSVDQVRSIFNSNTLNIASASLTETSFITRTGVTNRFQPTLTLRGWNKNSFEGPPSTGSCSYSWDPPNYSSPFGPANIAFTGDVTVRTPFTQIVFTPTTQSQNYSFVASFTEGPFTASYSGLFTANGSAFSTPTLTGPYTRDAGRARETFVSSVPHNGSFGVYYEKVSGELKRGSFGGDKLLVDFQVAVQDDTRGRHGIRCIERSDSFGNAKAALDGLLALIPAQPNRTDVAVRFFQVPQFQFPHSLGSVQQTNIFFDSVALYQDLDSVR